MCDEQAEILQAQLLGWENGECGRGSRSFKTDGKEHDLALRIPLGQRHGIRRRIDRSHRPAGRGRRLQAAAASRHAEHVAETRQYYLRIQSQAASQVDRLVRRDADGTARAMNQLDDILQLFFDPVPQQAVRLAAADLHNRPRASRRAPNFSHEALRQGRIAKFIEVLHGTVSACQPSSSKPAKAASVRSASAGPTRLMATPACTMT